MTDPLDWKVGASEKQLENVRQVIHSIKIVPQSNHPVEEEI
jgi:hypothetical protein